MKINAAQVLLADHDPARIALVCGDEQIDYRALRERVARCAGAWRQLGVAPGDRVAIRLVDGVDWVCAFLGALWAGAVAVGVNPRIAPQEWDYVRTEGRFTSILAQTREDAAGASDDVVLLLEQWQRQVAAAPAIGAQAMDAEQPAFWTHSSGTTGKPKAIVHGHRCALYVERASAERLGMVAADRLFASSRLFFCYPLANSLLAGLKLGATVVLDPRWPSASGVAETIARQRPTVFFSVPSMYRDLLRQGLAPALVGHGVRLFVSAGEALPASLRDAWFEQTGKTIANGFGASETLCLVLLDSTGAGQLAPSPGVSVEAWGGGAEAGPTRVCIRAPTLALGYWQRPEAQAVGFRDGGFCPADLFERADGRHWRFAGREDALVKVRGRWVDLVELEERLESCPGVAEVAAVVLPDDDAVDAVAVFYVLAPDAPPGTPGVLRALTEHWPHFQRPSCWRELAALPRTGTGKLTRRLLLEQHPSRSPAAASPLASTPGVPS